jgi:hypothetical protein
MFLALTVVDIQKYQKHNGSFFKLINDAYDRLLSAGSLPKYSCEYFKNLPSFRGRP